MRTDGMRLVPLDFGGKLHPLKGKWRRSSRDKTIVTLPHRQDAQGGDDSLCLSDFSIQDGVLEAEIKLYEAEPQKTNAHLVFRFQDEENYLFAGLGGWTERFVIAEKRPEEGKLGGRGWQTLCSRPSITELEPKRWYKVHLQFVGPNVALQVDGSAVLDWTLSGPRYYWPAGRIGLRGWGLRKAMFRNVNVWQYIPVTDPGPVLASLSVASMADPKLRGLAEHDLVELRRLDVQGTPKCAVVLCGCIAEAVLLDYLLRDEPGARKEAAALRKPDKRPIKRWSLETMIDVARALGVLNDSTYAISHVLRMWRNWIHPADPRAQALEPVYSQAMAAVEFLVSVVKDLHP